MERAARLALACLALVAALVAAWRVPDLVPCVQDDGFIYFRIAENAAHGHGPVFNPGERVDAATSPAWTWLLALCVRLGVSPRIAAGILGSLAAVGAVVASGRWALELAGARSRGAIIAALIPSLLIALDIRFLLAALSGMETALAACTWALAGRALVRRCVQNLPATGVGWMVLVAILVRAEFVLFVLAIAAWALARRTHTLGALRHALLPALVGGGLYLLAHTLYFGDPLPNTFHAKSAADWAHVRIGLAWLTRAPLTYPWLAFAAAACCVPWRRVVLAPIGLGMAAYAAFLVTLGGDHFVFHRPMLHVLPLALAALGGTVGCLWNEGRAVARITSAVGLAALLGFAASRRIAPGAFQWVRHAAQLGAVLARGYPPETRLGLFAIGATGYASHRPVVDALGLADARIARATSHDDTPLTPSDIGHERGDPDALLARADVIVLFGAYAPVPFESLDEVRPGFRQHERFLIAARAAVARGAFQLRNIEFAPGAYWAVLERRS